METINRNNYEEFFFLYVDDELDTVSKQAVENFAEQNPDLAIELEMLLQTRSIVEPVVFDKESLLRTEGNGIKEDNYQEHFLLYIDNELSASKREEVEMYILQHPHLQDEFTTLKQAVLAPEVVSYGNKKDLYRTERRRVIYLKSWRLAAAAVFIGVCAVGFWLMEKHSAAVTVAVNPSVKSQSQQNVAVTKPVDSIQPSIKQPERIVAQQQTLLRVKKEKKNVVSISDHKTEIATGNNKVDGNKIIEEPIIAIQHAPIQHNDIAKDQKEPPVVTTTIGVAQKQIGQTQNEVAALPQNQTQQQTQSNVYPVAYKELNTSDDDNSLHVGMLDLNKTKVKTFFKKAGRIFGNKSNDLANEDGKLQVVNFEIDTKKQ
ncbi:MAG: hypothetical protein JO072_09570 [Parafilimonas sp.]|nr:hypothetical protein [Parafilimonas sp.]